MALWDAIVVDNTVKDRLLSQAVLNFTLRPRIHRSDLPLHGIILLVGKPGTGKTSLARGLASRTAEILKTLGKFLSLEAEPHALASAYLGKSQKAVTELLGSTIAEYAATQPLIVLLDEVETLAANRSKMSMEANPIDVHRATDAVLAQLDQLAAKYPQLLSLATSNFSAAIDEAFLSRADLVITIEPPGPEACREILISTLARLYPIWSLKKVAVGEVSAELFHPERSCMLTLPTELLTVIISFAPPVFQTRLGARQSPDRRRDFRPWQTDGDSSAAGDGL